MRIERRNVGTARLVQAERVEDLDPAEVRGALVKLRPRLTRVERGALDVVATRAAVLAMGAAGVVVTPEVLEEPAPADPVSVEDDALLQVRRYVVSHAAGPEVRDAALGMLEQIIPASRS